MSLIKLDYGQFIFIVILQGQIWFKDIGMGSMGWLEFFWGINQGLTGLKLFHHFGGIILTKLAQVDWLDKANSG